MAKILVVDDEIGIRGLLAEILTDGGHEVTLAENAQRAREVLQKEKKRVITESLSADNAQRNGGTGKIFDLALLDIWMPDTDGVTLLKEWARDGELTMPVIMMSGHCTISNAVEATKIGASGFLEKPLTPAKLLKTIEQVLSRSTAQHVSANHLNAVSSLSTPMAAVLTATKNATERQGQPLSIEARYAERLVEEIPFNLPLRDARDVFEKIYFQYHLEREKGSMTRVAGCTGLERTHLYRKIRYLGVELTRKRGDN